ncbi:hypothetical protein [Pseudoduganella buxea]|uniref:Uncharacterized protein n=1 Tax=Pseudoduganella buxea TaxID=1949069 RepID=A0A6I3SW36_9BURK|nr:hypothetical protein [Pseudoduganella buxea]MTV53478.1 hypothetical protein [Pseudoduganella buxea]GGB95308.1 hypothetical protein GCM10011572_16610 [Pseudoduganella buxea]
MKAKFLAPIALVLAVAGCGGKASFTVGGSIAGLTNSGLVLTNNGERITVPAGATSYSFPTSIEYGNEYTIAFEKQPDHQTCIAAAGNSTLKGAAGYTETINVPLTCSINTFKLSGTVTGLTAAGLVIANGNGSELPIAKDAKDFAYPDSIASQTTYGLAVITQPAGLTCTVTNGTGTMQDAPVTNVVIACKPNA